ncbi:hypothetical protein [Bosea sp. AS-1]|uniref:hypothetical protein n=1 Tax=Bosea sp. AS-1 TaxID=2015316 RepID=UPI0012FE3066|nr:hypothetical protein [Bosea sp. AS-1]
MTANPTAPAAMPSEEEIKDLLLRFHADTTSAWRHERDDIATSAARAVLDLFAPILAEKSLHHENGERITRKDLNNAYREGSEKGRLAAHLIDGVNIPLNACCYRDGCRALEARALAAEAALAAIKARHAEWRKCMPADWEGDPLSDAIEAAAIRAQGE